MSVTYSSSSTLMIGFFNTHTLLIPISILRSCSHGFFLLGFLTIKMPELWWFRKGNQGEQKYRQNVFQIQILGPTNLQHSSDVKSFKCVDSIFNHAAKGNFLQVNNEILVKRQRQNNAILEIRGMLLNPES